MDADVDVSSVGLLALYSLNVHDKLLTVHLHNFADLVSFVVTTNDLKLCKTEKSEKSALHNLESVSIKTNRRVSIG